MILLKEILTCLTKDDLRSYKIFATRTQDSDGRKDIQLIDHVRKGYSEESFIEKHYGANRNAYYRLKNKLIEDIAKSLTIQYWSKNSMVEFFNHLLISHIFLMKDEYKFAWQYMKKALKVAEKLDDPQMKDFILSEMIKHSQKLNHHELIDLIEQRRKNRKILFKTHQIDDIIAVLENRIKTTQNLIKKDESLQEWVNDFISQIKDIDEEILNSRTLRLKLTKVLMKALSQEQNYQALESYLKDAISYLEESNFFTKNNHQEYIELVIYLLNTLSYNNKLEESIELNKKLKTLLEAYDRKFYKKYAFFYYNNLVNIYSQLNPKKGLEIISEFLEAENPIPESKEMYFVLIQQLLLYYKTNQLKESLKQVARIKIHNHHQVMNQEFQFNLFISELILKHELKDFDGLKILLKNDLKKFDELLQNKTFKHQKKFIELMSKIIEGISLKKLNNEITSLNQQSPEDESGLIKISDWAKKQLQFINS
jgi:hypothetical protein